MERIRRVSEQLTSNEEKAVTVSIEGVNKEIGVISMSYASNMNALNHVMRSQLIRAFRELQVHPSVKVICLRSTLPKVFCAGANIKDFETRTYEISILDDNFLELTQAITGVRKPIISAINKLALGGGLEIALLGDIIVASEDANLGLPEIKLGLMPGIGGTLISKIIGKSNAMKMILSGEWISARQALEWGIVSDVFKNEELHAKQLELAEKLCKMSLYTLSVAKAAVKFSYENNANQGLEFERRTFESLFSLPGAKEGIQAFIAKKKPDFKGK